jgi:hypothetical protein
MRRAQFTSSGVAVALATCLVACGGAGSAAMGQGVAVSLTPSLVTMRPGAQQEFAATVTGTADTSVSWSVLEGSAGGSITNGLYTAPASTGVYHVAALSQADTTKLAVATVTVSTSAPVVTVEISPASASTSIGEVLQFTATVSGNANTNVDWTVAEGASGGSISSSGLYTAPATAGTYHIVATSQADGTTSAVATVTVTAQAPAVTIVLSPTTASISTGQTLQFAATVTGSSNTNVSWTVAEGASGGSVN